MDWAPQSSDLNITEEGWDHHIDLILNMKQKAANIQR